MIFNTTALTIKESIHLTFPRLCNTVAVVIVMDVNTIVNDKICKLLVPTLLVNKTIFVSFMTLNKPMVVPNAKKNQNKDRKSTGLNSSHMATSYLLSALKK